MSELLVTTHQHRRAIATGVQLASHVSAHKRRPWAMTYKHKEPSRHLTFIDVYGWLLNKL